MLARIAPHLKSAQLIDHWFAADAHVNCPLLDEVGPLRATGMPVHLATLQEHERARYLWESLDFCAHFDGMHIPPPQERRSLTRLSMPALRQTDIAPDALFLRR